MPSAAEMINNFKVMQGLVERVQLSAALHREPCGKSSSHAEDAVQQEEAECHHVEDRSADQRQVQQR